MLPKTSIHINPKFRNVHINPNFMNKLNREPAIPPSTNIYINPRFLTDAQLISTTAVSSNITSSIPSLPSIHINPKPLAIIPDNEQQMNCSADATAKIITKTSRKLVRQPVAAAIALASAKKPIVIHNSYEVTPLVKIGSRKLIRACSKIPTSRSQSTNNVVQSKTISKPVQTKYKIVKERSTYKIDRRSIKTKTFSPSKQIGISSKTWISKTSLNESLTPTKVIVNNYKLRRIGSVRKSSAKTASASASTSANSTKSVHRTLAFLNINGILYKSTKNKLQKTVNRSSKATTSSPSDPQRAIIIRGERFTLDSAGKRLKKEASDATPTSKLLRKRIDIGGLTFVKQSNSNTYIQTNSHKSRYHLNVAKQRSINMLSKKLAKSNVPCPIYRKLGKCAAFERLKCSKLHDPKQVVICQKFLKSSCDKEKCLLSHDVSLSKMPTCRFFLMGICAKTDCLYLHKKVNENTKICVDFLRGYCPLADKCAKRHEYLCPEYEQKGQCKVTRCPYPHPKRVIKTDIHMEKIGENFTKKRSTLSLVPKTVELDENLPAQANKRSVSPNETEQVGPQRYFIDHEGAKDGMDVEGASEESSNSLLEEGKGKLSRALTKIEKMKLKYLQSNNSILDSRDKNKLEINQDSEQVPVPKRRKLGELPAFIPLD